LESAEATCAGDGIEAPDVLDLLAHLVEKSLVLMDPGGMRYRMLETVRAYAGEKLVEAGDCDGTRERHLKHFLGLAEAARPHLAGPVQRLWLTRLDPERENLLAAFAFAVRLESTGLSAVRLLHALRPYWITRGEMSRCLEMATEALAHPGLSERNDWRCMGLFSAGQVSFLMGRSPEAQAMLEECLTIARETGSAAIAMRVLQPLGMTCLALQDYRSATNHLSEALALAQIQGDDRETATALNALAMLYRLQGLDALARPSCERALAILRSLGDQENIGVGLLSLAMVVSRIDGPDAAGPLLAEAASIATQSGSLPVLLGALDVACGLAAARDQWSLAARLFGAAQAQREKAGARRDAADQAYVDEAMRQTRARLDATAFNHEVANGAGVDRIGVQNLLEAD
jgi:tetratricopeptide (TPR) repeat protein